MFTSFSNHFFNRYLTVLGVVAVSACLALAAQTSGDRAELILAALDRNQVAKTTHSVGTISVEDRYGTKISRFESYTQDADKSLLAFTSGDEKGQKILRLKDTIYLAYPEADKAVKIQGAALRDSVAGSDFSFEDMNGERGYASRYNPTIAGEENLNGAACTVLELNAKKPGLAYPYVKIWVATADSAVRRIEEYSQNKRLLKRQEVLAVKTIAGKTVPVEMVMSDLLKGKSKTTIKLDTVEWDKPLDAKLFGLAELSW